MNVFDIIGPIMIGPSSSHTAGAVRLGRVANKLIDGRKLIKLNIYLSGSFAKTYRGHGTDKALLAGIMGYNSDDVDIRNAIEIAKERGISYEFIEENIRDAHPNTARIEFFLENGEKGCVEGASIGGGNIKVDFVNGMRADFNTESNTLLVLHYDRPGVIADVTRIMRQKYADINICNFRLSRIAKGDKAIMTIEIDGDVDTDIVDDISELDNIINAIIIKAV